MAFRDTKAKVKKDYLQALPGDHRLYQGPQRHQRQDKENLIHILNMVFGVGHVYIIKDTNSVI